jgi:subtilase family serine protease
LYFISTESGHKIESELDVQYITSLGQGIEMQNWLTTAVNYPNELLDWSYNVLAAAANGTAPPLFSVSYGSTESSFGLEFVTKFNSQLMLLGSAGITVIIGSGDNGAGGGCIIPPFEPIYPGCSPYVTSVGGVSGGTPGNSPLGEKAWIFVKYTLKTKNVQKYNTQNVQCKCFKLKLIV